MYAHSFLYTLTAHTGQQHLRGWLQEFEKYIVFPQIESPAPSGEFVPVHSRQATGSGQPNKSTLQKRFFFFVVVV